MENPLNKGWVFFSKAGTTGNNSPTGHVVTMNRTSIEKPGWNLRMMGTQSPDTLATNFLPPRYITIKVNRFISSLYSIYFILHLFHVSIVLSTFSFQLLMTSIILLINIPLSTGEPAGPLPLIIFLRWSFVTNLGLTGSIQILPVKLSPE